MYYKKMINQFLLLHSTAILLHVCCFLYSFLNTTAYTTGIPVNTKTVTYLNTTDKQYYNTVNTYNFEIPSVIILHGIVAFVTVLFHSFVYIPIHFNFSDVVWSQGFFTPRWFEYSITCTIMSISSVMSSGCNDFNMLISYIFYGIALQLIGCSIEQMKEQYKPLLFIGFLLQIGSSYNTIWYLFTATGIGQYQFIEFIAYTFYYGLFPINCVFDAIYRKDCFIKTDWIYNVLSLSSKFALFWIQVGEIERKINGGIWPEIQVYILGIVFPFLLLVIGLYKTPQCTIIMKSEDAPNKCLYFIRYISKLRFLTKNTGKNTRIILKS